VRYDLLLCDLDNTLVDFDACERLAFASVCRSAHLPESEEYLACYSRCNLRLWLELEKGKLHQEELAVRRFEDFLRETGLQGDPAQMNAVYMDSLSRQAVLFPETLACLRSWRECVRVMFVTNGISRVQHGRFRRMPFAEMEGEMLVSQEVGAAKPDPRMLEIAMERAGVKDRRRVLVLGDSLTSDMKAACNAGMDSCWINRRGLPRPQNLKLTYEIRGLEEVLGILKGDEER